MKGQYILNDNGEPVPEDNLFTWGEWMGTGGRHAASTSINGVWVSTIFLGLDHNFFDGPPLLWETMEFNGKQHQMNQWRYTSKEAAVKNHERVCERVRKRFNKKHLHPKDQAARSKFLLGDNHE